MTELLNTLYLQTPGTTAHLDGDTVRLHHPEVSKVRRLPLIRLEDIVAFGGVNISQELALRCADDGRAITWLSGYGKFRARIHGPTTGNPLLRHAQHVAHNNDTQRLKIANNCVAGKIQNSRQVLLKAARDTTETRQTQLREEAERLGDHLQTLSNSNDLGASFGVEGSAARHYFGSVKDMIVSEAKMTFTGRNRRPPTDPINCMLSFLYGMLRVSVQGAIEQVGLDPYIGYLHGIRPGKPALALDLMEEFRPLQVDRLALTLVNRKTITSRHFEKLPNNAVRLTDKGRKELLIQWQKARTKTWRHKLLDRDVPAALLPLVQTRILARHLRGDLPAYQPWTAT